jgi:hypothetical protein
MAKFLYITPPADSKCRNHNAKRSMVSSLTNEHNLVAQCAIGLQNTLAETSNEQGVQRARWFQASRIAAVQKYSVSNSYAAATPKCPDIVITTDPSTTDPSVAHLFRVSGEVKTKAAHPAVHS